MRLVRFLDDHNEPRLGVEQDSQTAKLIEGDLLDAWSETDKLVQISQRLPPVEPVNIFCVGLNYRDHASETAAEIPEQPVIFMKPTSTAIGAGMPICIPRCCTRGDEVDYEVELAVVIGRMGRDISEADALDHVLGYTVANDVSARRWQKNGGAGQWIRGKSFDTFCPMGPVLVTADEISDPQQLSLSTTVDGKTLQDHHTGDMIFPVAKLISFISQDTTLLPGTVILTGTPAGVGVARKPPVFLEQHRQVTVSIERIGELTNPIHTAKPS